MRYRDFLIEAPQEKPEFNDFTAGFSGEYVLQSGSINVKLLTEFYYGPIEDWQHWGKQQKNYEAISRIMASAGKRLNYLAVGKGKGLVTFAAWENEDHDCPGLIWNMKPSLNVNSHNYIINDGFKVKMTSFLAAKNTVAIQFVKNPHKVPTAPLLKIGDRITVNDEPGTITNKCDFNNGYICEYSIKFDDGGTCILSRVIEEPLYTFWWVAGGGGERVVDVQVLKASNK